MRDACQREKNVSAFKFERISISSCSWTYRSSPLPLTRKSLPPKSRQEHHDVEGSTPCSCMKKTVCAGACSRQYWCNKLFRILPCTELNLQLQLIALSLSSRRKTTQQDARKIEWPTGPGPTAVPRSRIFSNDASSSQLIITICYIPLSYPQILGHESACIGRTSSWTKNTNVSCMVLREHVESNGSSYRTVLVQEGFDGF
jgi:hypothetical protein